MEKRSMAVHSVLELFFLAAGCRQKILAPRAGRCIVCEVGRDRDLGRIISLRGQATNFRSSSSNRNPLTIRRDHICDAVPPIENVAPINVVVPSTIDAMPCICLPFFFDNAQRPLQCPS